MLHKDLVYEVCEYIIFNKRLELKNTNKDIYNFITKINKDSLLQNKCNFYRNQYYKLRHNIKNNIINTFVFANFMIFILPLIFLFITIFYNNQI